MPVEPVGQLNVDIESVADNNSATKEIDSESYIAQLTTTVHKLREENGRTYHVHKDLAHVGPNDIIEQDRLDSQHTLYLRTLDNQLFLAPIFREAGTPVNRALDIGTGTGCWAIDFTDDHPQTVIIGVDLSPI
ncbi:hypothetical protein ACHAPA_007844 [Fusarium lateritium]